MVKVLLLKKIPLPLLLWQAVLSSIMVLLTVTGNGTIDTSASIYGGYGAIDNYGTLTIENGTYTGAKLANGATIKKSSERRTYHL